MNAMKVNNIFEAEQIVSSNTFTPRKRGMTAAVARWLARRVHAMRGGFFTRPCVWVSFCSQARGSG